MSDVVNSDTTVSVLADIRARLTKLESFPPSGMAVLAQASSATPTAAFSSTTDAYISPCTTPSFQLLRPVPIWAIATYTMGESGLFTSQAQMSTHVAITGDAGTTLNVYAPYQTMYTAPNNSIATGLYSPTTSMILFTPNATQIAAVTNWSARLTGLVPAASGPMLIYAWSIIVFQIAG